MHDEGKQKSLGSCDILPPRQILHEPNQVKHHSLETGEGELNPDSSRKCENLVKSNKLLGFFCLFVCFCFFSFFCFQIQELRLQHQYNHDNGPYQYVR